MSFDLLGGRLERNVQTGRMDYTQDGRLVVSSGLLGEDWPRMPFTPKTWLGYTDRGGLDADIRIKVDGNKVDVVDLED